MLVLRAAEWLAVLQQLLGPHPGARRGGPPRRQWLARPRRRPPGTPLLGSGSKRSLPVAACSEHIGCVLAGSSCCCVRGRSGGRSKHSLCGSLQGGANGWTKCAGCASEARGAGGPGRTCQALVFMYRAGMASSAALWSASELCGEPAKLLWSVCAARPNGQAGTLRRNGCPQ